MPPPAKRRKKESSIEEIAFDSGAREEYLTGFHKRKLQRIKDAQETAAKKEKALRVEEGRKLREERKEELRKHVETVNAMLRKATGQETASDGDEAEASDEESEWTGIEETPAIDNEHEYIDEGRYTTVTIESMDLSRTSDDEHNSDDAGAQIKKHPSAPRERVEQKNSSTKGKSRRSQKIEKQPRKKRKFRYESKAERKVTRFKERSGNRAKAKARRTDK